MRYPLHAVVAVMFLVLVQITEAQSAKKDSSEAEIRAAANGFVSAFVNLDWQRFRAYFAPEATAFFPPSAKLPTRIDGKSEIERVFNTVFENARKQRPGPPYLQIEPKDLKIQVFGDVGVVTFHLNDPGMFGRRTVVFRKAGQKWLIVHLHASGIPE